MNNETAKALKKSHHSVKEMLKDIGADSDVIAAVEEVHRQNVTNALAKIRLSKGLTQKEMARLLKCTQGRISKLETGRDADLRLKDLSDYAEATNVSLSVTIGKQNCAEAIKHHLLTVKQHIDQLVSLDDGNDAALTHGLQRFLDEVLWNAARLIGSSKRALKKVDALKASQTPEIEIISSSDSLASSESLTSTSTSSDSMTGTKGKSKELVTV
jgi:transcriptional regulator with XRE-family HTH domain